MTAIITELTLVPYTACLGIEKLYLQNETLELIIDSIWLINMVITFCTGTLRDGQLEKEFKLIAKRYLKGIFALDLLSLLPPIIIRISIENEDWDENIRQYLYSSYLLKILQIA